MYYLTLVVRSVELSAGTQKQGRYLHVVKNSSLQLSVTQWGGGGKTCSAVSRPRKEVRLVGACPLQLANKNDSTEFLRDCY